ncbi:2-polyprenyl-3-methyl-5-hydroxy-6-metoxy-1,4-benzoquinol methylase [Mesoflavibacter sabulilitoris]|nr:class I SAM-dependent methyltransferase [Mesoflavibacter zeaxanthinifaciens]MBB3123523.1 2-polyprenyl-3-methyl-5-hydroxy-6-metoxy-1,4-benzoquinol methylase [Mesoflavibacter zeaxanthinifaciens subsp. sabulilitoris]
MEQEYKDCKSCQGKIEDINDTHKLVKCNNCHLVFCKTIYTVDQFESVYNNLYNDSVNPKYLKHAIIEFENLKKGIVKIGFNRRVLLNRFVKTKDKVLEIGSGIGLIGYYLTFNKKIKNYLGVEIDMTSHEKAKSLHINSIQGDFKIMTTLSNDYDVIMLWEVLEHIQELDQFFKLAHSRLKKGGKLIVSVPNYDKRRNYKLTSDKLYQSGPPIHLNFFTKQSLTLNFENNGFKVIYFRVKKLPYFNKSLSFIKTAFKALLGNYHGATLYLVAQKK